MSSKLSITNHDRNIVGLKYIYPVMSRRAGGLSIGVNFNVNNACNWRCIYCQVPDLSLGAPPELDFSLLERELRGFLSDVLQGDFFSRFQVEYDNRVIKDIAISGNGEPTSVENFAKAIELIGRVATDMGVLPGCNFVLISNGSLIHQSKVQLGLKQLDKFNGEVWFKLDSATSEGRARINHAGQGLEGAYKNLLQSARLCRTKIQTCLVDFNHEGLSQSEEQAYLSLMARVKKQSKVSEIMLYSMARPSFQPEAENLQAVSPDVLARLAHQLKGMGFIVNISS